MKNNLFIYVTLLALGTLSPMSAYAEGDVHFGTIFVEDLKVDDSDQNQNINYLTDQSKKQEELETLFKKEIGEPNRDMKKMDMTPRRPASVPASAEPKVEAPKVGVVQNSELPQQIMYFLELRSFPGNQAVTVHKGSNPSSQVVMKLEPGELIKVVDGPSQFIHKLRMDRDNQGLWKKIKTREQDVQNPTVYYDWRNFETITSHDFPVELDIVVPRGLNSIPVFSRPGAWTWKDCGLNAELCIDNIDLHTTAYLFDATIVDTRLAPTMTADHQLFYKIGYQIKDKDGKLNHKVGWIPSRQAKRKISQLPKSLLATRNPNGLGTYESDMDRFKRLQKYYIFDANIYSENRNMSRWINSAPGQSAEVFFQNIAFDGVAQVNTFSLEQDFLGGDKFTQQGVALGIGIYSPIFIDLEIQGTATYTVPFSYEGDSTTFKKSPLFRGEQWLLYTTPFSVSNTPFKFGVGAYYISMFASQREFGFNSLVGFQGKALFENPQMWFGMRYGPTGQDFNFKFENRELGADFGWRLNPERRYESWAIYGDYSDTSYVSPSGNKTTFQLISIGVRKQF